jgi:hypothetical protein
LVHVNPPPDSVNVFDSSARQNAYRVDWLGGLKLPVTSGFAVPVAKAGDVLAANAMA